MDEYQAVFDRFEEPPGWFPLFTGVRDSGGEDPCTQGAAFVDDMITITSQGHELRVARGGHVNMYCGA
eukprot:4780261-Pyramimonas_sp.AAC.2